MFTCHECHGYISQDGGCPCGRSYPRVRYFYHVGEEAYAAEQRSAERERARLARLDADGGDYDACADGLT